VGQFVITLDDRGGGVQRAGCRFLLEVFHVAVGQLIIIVGRIHRPTFRRLRLAYLRRAAAGDI